MKSRDYFYEFFDFLDKYNLTRKEDVINYVSSFLKEYFDEKGYKNIDREDLFDDICNQLDNMDDEEKFIRCRNAWLDIGIFKGRSAAECTEHSAICQNLLSICDIESCYVSGHLNTNCIDEDHAFNIFKMDDKYYLLDSSNPIVLFDETDKYSGCKSFFREVSYDEVIDFLKNGGNLRLPKFNYMKKPDGNIIMVDKEIYTYTTSSNLLNKESCNSFFNIANRTL